MSAGELITLTEASVTTRASANQVAAMLSFSRGGTYNVRFAAPTSKFLEQLNESFLHRGTSTDALAKMASELFENNLRSVFRPIAQPSDRTK